MLTVDDFDRFPENDLLRHEILAGEHYTQRAPNTRHQEVVGNLLLLLGDYAQPRRDLFYTYVNVVLSRCDVVIPDLIYVTRARRSIVTEEYVEGSPDLILELVIEETRRVDEGIKRQQYELLGVGEYWLIYPCEDRVTIYRRDGMTYQAPIEMTSGAITTPLLPGFSLPMSELFSYGP